MGYLKETIEETCAYMRDRGETDCEAFESESLDEVLKYIDHAYYYVLLRLRKWQVDLQWQDLSCQESEKVMSLTSEDLRQFTGSETFTRHGINRKTIYTEGVAYIAEQGGAYWLLDTIAISNMFEDAVAKEEFQLWTLRKNADNSATLTCEDGNSNIVRSESIPFTDFPLDFLELYYVDNTILLPTEY